MLTQWVVGSRLALSSQCSSQKTGSNHIAKAKIRGYFVSEKGACLGLHWMELV